MISDSFNPKTHRRLTTNNEMTLEYDLLCGHVQRRKTDPPVPVGTAMYCWPCGRHTIIEARNIVMVRRTR
jgi:hypothetical protein